MMKKRTRRTTKKAKQKSSLQKLKRKVTRDMGQNFKGVQYNPPGEIKMSDALEDVIEPFVADAGTKEAMTKLVGLGAMAWNFTLMPPVEQKKGVQELAESMSAEPEDYEMLIQIVNQLMQRKRKLFPDVDRFIVNYTVEDVGDGWHLSVASTMSPEKGTDA